MITKFRSNGSWVPLSAKTEAAEQFAHSWVSFSGQGALPTYESYNVTQLKDLGKGVYEVNYSPLASIGYAPVASCNQETSTDHASNNVTVYPCIPHNTVKTNYARVQTYFPGNTAYKADPKKVSVVIFK